MKRNLILGLACALTAGCFTPAGLREGGVDLTFETQKATLEFAECFIDKYQNKLMRPSFTPRSNGGIIEFNYQTVVANNALAAIQIEDAGTHRRINVFVRSRDKDLNQNIESCL